MPETEDIASPAEETNDDSSPYSRWTRRIARARKIRKDWERKFLVEKCERFFLGLQNDGKGPRVLNHFLPTLKVTQTNLLFENPKPLVRPKPGKEVASRRKASVGEGVLEAVMEQDDNFEDAVQLGLLQSWFRVGVVKVIYDPKLEPNPNAGEPIMSFDGDGNPMLDPQTGEHVPVTDPMTGAPVIEPDFVVQDEAYRFEWIDAGNMLFPDSGPYGKRWPWVGEEITVPVEEARADERFPAELRAILKSNTTKKKDGKEAPTSQPDESSEHPDDQLFRYVELYDIKAKRWLIIAEDQEFKEPLLDDMLPDGIEDHPYSFLSYIPIVGPDPSPWPLPYTYPWLDPQEEYNIRRMQQMEGAKRSARKMGYEESTFASEDETVKMMSPKDMELVKLTDVMRPPVPLGEASLNASIYNDIPLLMNDWRTITGQTGARLSGVSDADTATESTFVERAANLRDADLQRAVQKWLRSTLRKMFQLIKKTLTVKMFVKLRGMNDNEVTMFMQSVYGIPPEMIALVPGLQEHLIARYGNEKIEPVGREDLTFEADIDVVPGSTKPRSLTAERSQFLEMLQIIAQAPQLLLSRLLLEELFKKYEFVNPALIDELQLLAQTMMMVNSNVAGRGGQNTSSENTEGQGPSSPLAEARGG